MLPDDGRVISTFIIQALTGEPLTVFGDGSQTRSFCYVDDLIEGLLRLMAAPDEVTGPINLGNPHETPILELAETIIAMTGSKSRIEFKALPADDPRQRRPDIAAAERLLDWQPKVTLTDGLAKTISFFKERLRKGSLNVERS
jgi:UDP-glucuronate decarboxylase